MAEATKFTDEEMKELKALQDEFNNSILQLGQLNVEEINLENAASRLAQSRVGLQNSYKELLKKEKVLAEKLNARYGAGVLDPKTGIFTPAPKTEAA